MQEGNTVHIFPTPAMKYSLPAPAGALSYHGGPIMPSIKTFVIFWIPPKLQNGTATSLPVNYRTLVKQFMADYPAHGIANNSTQYYSTSGGVNTYFKNAGSFGGFYVDTNAYPASGCSDPVTPGNCITDAQLRTEIQNVMTSQGWTSGLGKMYLVFTSSGEGSCIGQRVVPTQRTARITATSAAPGLRLSTETSPTLTPTIVTPPARSKTPAAISRRMGR